MNEEQICSACKLPLHRDDAKRYAGRFISHEASRCIQLLSSKLEKCDSERKAANREVGELLDQRQDLGEMLKLTESRLDKLCRAIEATRRNQFTSVLKTMEECRVVETSVTDESGLARFVRSSDEERAEIGERVVDAAIKRQCS